MSSDSPSEAWPEIIVRVLKENGIDLVAYIPDNVISPLLQLIEADDYFTVVLPAREEEAVGIVTGAYLGGRRGIVLMQTSGFATITNALASLVCPFQIPLVMIVSERGTIGEFQQGQAMVWRTMRPVLESLGIEHFSIQDRAQVEFVVDRLIKQAFSTQAPVGLLLSPLLTKREH